MEKWPLTKTEITKYVSTLDSQVQRLFGLADDLMVSLEDTLEDDFQIVVDILHVFQKYARRRQEDR
jgi:hypothetical protein